jgi:peptidyl-prolyl cis-trans isomerase A (cyclophilin A)
MPSKRDVRDARFRDREPVASKPSDEPRPRPSKTAAPPRSARSAEPVERDDAKPAAPTPWYLSMNVVVPVVLTLGMAWALYEKFQPDLGGAATPPVASADGGAEGVAPPAATVDAGVALDPNPVRPAHREPTSPDPRGGRFSLAQATEGLTGEGPLHADIITSMGAFDCELLAQQAPNTGATFVGLARGRREFWDAVAGEWARRPFYNGSIFHRVIPDFMIQGGDVLRSGSGGTGYEIADENVQGHDAPGLLCMANHGPNTNGGQFFITEAARAHLDGTYSIFGRCTPTALVARITHVARNDEDRPNEPVYILRVDVRKGARE